MVSETFADELRAAVAGDKFTLYTELMLQAADLLDHKDEQINTRPAPATDIDDLLKKAVAAFKALSPEQQAEMLEEQRQSWVRGNVGLSRDERDMTLPMMRALKIVRETNDKGRQALQAWADSKTRPAPAATDTGLVRYDLSIFGNGIVEMGGGAYVRADQADELLAAERAEFARLKSENDAQADQIDELQMTPWPEWASKVLAVIRERSGYDGYDDATEGVDLPAELDECMAAIEADNAAKDARIKELENVQSRDGEMWVRQSVVKALEAKLATAEKVHKAAEHVVWFDWSDNDDDAVKAVSDLRSVLEGQPYKCEWQQRAETAETKLEAAEKELERLTEFANSFHITVVDNFYKDVTLHLDLPHSLSIRIPNDSTKSFIFKDLEERRRAVLGGKPS